MQAVLLPTKSREIVRKIAKLDKKIEIICRTNKNSSLINHIIFCSPSNKYLILKYR